MIDLVSIPKLSEEGIADNALVWLVTATVIFAAVSLYAIFSISDNAYLAGYYTLSTLLDSSGVNLGLLTSIAAESSYNFYLIVAISVLDGITKMAIIGFVIAAFIDFITKVDIRTRMLVFTRKRLAKNHVIVCGYSTLAEKLCNELKAKGATFVIVEKDPLKADTLTDLGYFVVDGDFTKAETLDKASVKSAKAVIFSSKNDFENLLGVITTRYINENVNIISRARDEDNVSRMHKAGASLCVIPEALAGLEIGASIVSNM